MGVLLLMLLACQAVRLPPAITPPGSPTPPIAPTTTLSGRASASPPEPTAPWVSTPSSQPATALPTATTTPTVGGFSVRTHPDGGLYMGDQVSFEVIAPPDLDVEGLSVQAQVGESAAAPLGPANFTEHGIGRRSQATLLWAWDTAGLSPGTYVLTFSVLPEGPAWSQTLSLQPASALPPPEPQARWVTSESECCLVYTISGTAAQRDLEQLLEMADAQADSLTRRVAADFEGPVSLVLIPRVVGHGGFANDELSISYLDRNYAGGETAMVLHHEMAHLLDRQMGGDFRPTILVEGLAVYLSGGHFKPEPLMARAAALLDLGFYLPLVPLVDNFYLSQHEIGYIQAGSLVEYMVDTWGWEAFDRFYRDIHPPEPGGGQAEAMDEALYRHFALTLTELEQRYLEALRARPLEPLQREDVRLTVELYDAIRRYQQALDPSAYFLTAWLLDGKEMRKRGIVADYVRHPSGPENLALEALLVAADAGLRTGDYPHTAQTLYAANTVLDAMAQGLQEPFALHPVAAAYYDIVLELHSQGYQAQSIQLSGDSATVWANRSGPELVRIDLSRRAGGWSILRVSQ